MKEMTSLNIIESNGPTMTAKRNPYLLGIIKCLQKNFTMAGKLKKRLPGRCWITRKCDILLKTILTGKIEGKRGPGRR